MSEPDDFSLPGFVLEQAAKQPIARRIKIYRSLARLIGDKRDQDSLNALAESLEHAERDCREFEFSFEQKSLNKSSK